MKTPIKKSALASLQLTTLPATVTLAVDPVIERRNRIIMRLEEQKALLSNPNLTRTVKEGGKEKNVKIRSWVRQAPDGSHVMMVKAGLRPVEFAKGKAGVAVPAMDKLPGIIDTLIAAVQNGELDDALAVAAASSKRKPKTTS